MAYELFERVLADNPADEYDRMIGTFETAQEARNRALSLAPGKYVIHNEEVIDVTNYTHVNEAGQEFFAWQLEVEVAKCWVEDGFDFNPDRILDLEMSLVGWAESGEVNIRVVKAPSDKKLRKARGE